MNNNIEDHQRTIFSLINSHDPVLGYCFHYEVKSKLPLHGLAMLPSKEESCPTAHEVRVTQWNLMGLTYLLGACHINRCVHTQTILQNRSHIIHIQNVHNSSTCAHASGVSRERHKMHRQAASNADQPCQWPSRQIHRISRGTSPWTTDQNRLQGAKLCNHHHQIQRGNPPSWGQGTQQQQDGHPQHTGERHCALPELSNRNRLTKDPKAYVHACMQKNKEAEDSSREVVHEAI